MGCDARHVVLGQAAPLPPLSPPSGPKFPALCSWPGRVKVAAGALPAELEPCSFGCFLMYFAAADGMEEKLGLWASVVRPALCQHTGDTHGAPGALCPQGQEGADVQQRGRDPLGCGFFAAGPPGCPGCNEGVPGWHQHWSRSSPSGHRTCPAHGGCPAALS